MFKKNFGLCSECFEPITNPICIDCLAIEVKSWLESQSSEIKEVVGSKLKKLRYSTKEIGQTTGCILCGKNTEVCPFCFTENLSYMFRKAGLDRRKVNQFVAIFNYGNVNELNVLNK